MAKGERRDLFTETANTLRVHPAIVEKDFWVCWVLDYLFNESAWRDCLAFKGGTSLSKAYNAIERFSEDIDLVLDWRILGYTRDEPWTPESATQQSALGREANARTVG
jgi:predicted nucleotidyltransferase component of viral defense system